MNLTNFWSFIKKFPKILEVVEKSENEIISFAEENLGQKIISFTEALYLLEREKISFRLEKKYNYIIYETDGYIEEKNNKEDPEFLSIWLYGNGGYSSMLNILN